MKAGEKNYLKESNGTKANCNANVTQVRKSRIYRGVEDQGGWPRFPTPQVFVAPPSLRKRPPPQKSLHLSPSWPVLPFKHAGGIWVSSHSHVHCRFFGICLHASSLFQIKFHCQILLNFTSETYGFISWIIQCPTKLQISAVVRH